jgi:transposase-like protein
MDKYTIKDFNREFPDDAACLEFIKNSRWPDGIRCAKCDAITSHHRIEGRKVYSCAHCGSHVSPTAGTIFHKSSTSLRTWFYAMFLMASTRTGISAKQLERETGVTYKTAWRMFTQIRKLMAQEDGLQLFGDVEVDETYIGGKEKNKHANKKLRAGRGPVGKTTVVGIVEREGPAVVKVQPDNSGATLTTMIQDHVHPKRAIVFTDEFAGYNRLSSLGYAHETVQHRARQYVNGRAHTNNIEGFWGNTKRGIDGVHHVVTPKYLQGYLDSYVFRYNHRSDEVPMFQTLMDQVPLRLRAG